MVWLHISSGRGPGESELAVKKCYEYMLKELKARTIEYYPSDHGYYSVLLFIEDNEVARDWEGPILWICKSPIRKNWKRKNWFISIALIQEPEKSLIEVDEKDLMIQTMQSGGPGGQHQNKTESAVRITHIPTGIVTTSREERSQHRNKKLAIAKLIMLLENKANSTEKDFEKYLWSLHNNIVRGNPIKTFKGENFELQL